MEKTTENPSTKKAELKMMLARLIDTVRETPALSLLPPLFCAKSAIVVPEIYARNAGIIGSMQGAAKELSPASAAIASVSSAIHMGGLKMD